METDIIPLILIGILATIFAGGFADNGFVYTAVSMAVIAASCAIGIITIVKRSTP